LPELRKDPIVGRWVIISTERGKRPSDFTVADYFHGIRRHRRCFRWIYTLGWEKEKCQSMNMPAKGVAKNLSYWFLPNAPEMFKLARSVLLTG